MRLKSVFLVLLLFALPAFALWHPQKSNTDARLLRLSIVNGNVVWVSSGSSGSTLMSLEMRSDAVIGPTMVGLPHLAMFCAASAVSSCRAHAKS